jgi:hypothetical protein
VPATRPATITPRRTDQEQAGQSLDPLRLRGIGPGRPSPSVPEAHWESSRSGATTQRGRCLDRPSSPGLGRHPECPPCHGPGAAASVERQ